MRKKNLPNRRSPGKLEAKLARDYVHRNLVSAHRNHDPNEIKETMFVGTQKGIVNHIQSKTNIKRTGLIPEYPQGLVCFDSRKQGYFNKTSISEETRVRK